MRKRHILFITIIGLMVLSSCDSLLNGFKKETAEQVLEKAKNKQATITFRGSDFNDDNTFSLNKNDNGEYNLVLPLKDCLQDIKCSSTCDPSVRTGHSGDHLWIYLKNHNIPYTFNGNDWPKTMISVVEGLLSKDIPITVK